MTQTHRILMTLIASLALASPALAGDVVVQLDAASGFVAGGDGRTQEYGLIAEEVAKVAPEFVVHDEAGEPYSVRYHLLAPLLLNEVQEQQRTIEAQTARIERRSARLEALESQLGRATR